MNNFRERMGRKSKVHENWSIRRHQDGAIGPCGDCGVTAKSELVEVLEFTHFYEHFTFEKTNWSERGKHLKKYIRVIVAVELDTVGAKPEPVR